MKNLNWKMGSLALGVLALASVDAQAQVSTTQATTAQAASAMRGFAGASFTAPIAFGAGWGAAGVGLYGQTIDSADEDFDGALGIAFGLGDPDKYVGLETQVAVSSITGANDSDFGENGDFGFKLHTNLPGDAAFAVGVVGVAPWGKNDDPVPGTGKKAVESSAYAVGSKVFALGTNPLVVSLGIGDEFFNDPDEDGANVLGSVAFYFTRRISVIGEYTGRFANAAVSVAPFDRAPLTISLGAVNIGEEHGGDTEFAGSISYGFNF